MINILDIPFSTLSKKEILTRIEQFFDTKKQYQVCTPNPEFLLESLKNPEFKKVLQNSALNIPDGIGILWAARVQHEIEAKHIINRRNEAMPRFYGAFQKFAIALKYLAAIIFYPSANKKIIPGRITGTDLMKDIFENFPNKKIFLLGAAEGVAEKAVNNLKSQINSNNQKTNSKQNTLYPIPHTLYEYYSGSPKPSDESGIISKINKFEPDILFVAFGAPKQDLWIAKNLSKIPSVKVAIGVGGAFDFWAGIKKRAPKIFQILGIEWLFRLFIEPKRFRRIFNAVIIFPWKFLRNLA